MTHEHEVLSIVRRHVLAMLDEIGGVMGGTETLSSTAGPKQGLSPVPTDWRFVENLEGVTYSWPELEENYLSFKVFEGKAPDGSVSSYAVGECERTEVWGRDRKYFIVFILGSGGGSKQPLVEFLEADDYDETRECVAVVRGNGGPRGQRMFDPADDLPDGYEHLRIETYRDRVAGTPQLRGWNKLAVVAHEDDVNTMLTHAAIQYHLRHAGR